MYGAGRRTWMFLAVAGIVLIFLSFQPEVRPSTNGSAGEILWTYPAAYSVVSISPEGDLVAAGTAPVDGGGDLYLFKVTGELLWRLPVEGGIRSVSFSEDGRYLVVLGASGIHLLDAQNHSHLWNFTTEDEAMSGGASVNAEYVIAGARDKKIYLFARNGSLLESVETGAQVYSVSATPDGKVMVGSSNDGKVYVLGTDPPGLLGSLTTGGSVYDVAVSDDGRYAVAGTYVAAGPNFGRVVLLDLQEMRPVVILTPTDVSTSVDISSDGSVAVAGSNDMRAYVFGIGDLPNWSFPTGGAVYGTAVSDDGRYVAIGSTDKKVYFFRSESPEPLWVNEDTGRIRHLAMSSDGRYIAVAARNSICLLRGFAVTETYMAAIALALPLALLRRRPTG